MTRPHANFGPRIRIDGFFTTHIRGPSAPANALADQIDANATIVRNAIGFLRSVKQLLDEAIAARDLAKLQALSSALGTKTHQIADGIAHLGVPLTGDSPR